MTRPSPFRTTVLTTAIVLVSLTTPPAAADTRNLSIGWLMVMDWDSDYPEAAECLVSHAHKPPDWTITHESIYLEDVVSGADSLTAYDLVVTTGHESYQFTPQEVAILEQFIDAGGILWFDDCGGIDIDNFPYGMEIDFGIEGGLPAWYTAYGEYYTINDQTHPLVNNRFYIEAQDIRTDAGLADSQWFTPIVAWDPGYDVVIEGIDVTSAVSGPMMIAHREGHGKIVATAIDVTCALECELYGNADYNNGHLPMFDYYFVFNMLVWVDSDGDGIYDRDEGAFNDTDTDSDGTPDWMDTDSDDDGIYDYTEAGDDNPDTPPLDSDGDGLYDFRDADSDGDGIDDADENSVDATGNGVADVDVDGDGTPNYLDDDTDGDGHPDEIEGEDDLDGDGIPNFADADDGDGPDADLDGDGIPNGQDNCPDVDNTDQADMDGDGTGDACDDTDDSGDDDDTPGLVEGDDVFVGHGCQCRTAAAATRPGAVALAVALTLLGLGLRRRR